MELSPHPNALKDPTSPTAIGSDGPAMPKPHCLGEMVSEGGHWRGLWIPCPPPRTMRGAQAPGVHGAGPKAEAPPSGTDQGQRLGELQREVAALRQEAGEAAALIAALRSAAVEAGERQAALQEEGEALRRQGAAAEAEGQAVAERLAVAEGQCAVAEAELQNLRQQGGRSRAPLSSAGWRGQWAGGMGGGCGGGVRGLELGSGKGVGS